MSGLERTAAAASSSQKKEIEKEEKLPPTRDEFFQYCKQRTSAANNGDVGEGQMLTLKAVFEAAAQVEMMAEYCAEHPEIEMLSCICYDSNITIGAALADFVRDNTTILYLKLAPSARPNDDELILGYLMKQGLSDKAAVLVAQALDGNRTLRWLDIEGTTLKVDALAKLADSLRHHPCLTQLHLDAKSSGLSLFCPAFRWNHFLKSVHFAKKSKLDAPAIVENISFAPLLQVLRPPSDFGEKYISQALSGKTVCDLVSDKKQKPIVAGMLNENKAHQQLREEIVKDAAEGKKDGWAVANAKYGTKMFERFSTARAKDKVFSCKMVACALRSWQFVPQWRGLTELLLPHNLLTTLPMELSNLSNLNTLDISCNLFEELPWDSLLQLPNLSYLDASFNRLRIIPALLAAVGSREFQKLQTLLLHCNQLIAVDSSLFQAIPSVMMLDLAHNGLAQLPGDISGARRVQKLYLQYNDLAFLPPSIGTLKDLTLLDVSHNSLDYLPPTLADVKNTVMLSHEGNPLTSVPTQALAGNWKELVSYLSDLKKGSAQYSTVKLMLFGDGGMGKTTLLKSFRQAKGCTNDKAVKKTLKGSKETKASHLDNVATDGIDIHQWKYKQVTFNSWDFAGQEVYYNTHSFFLSEHSIFLICFSLAEPLNRERLDYWLRKLSIFNSPIIFVGTNADKPVCPANEALEELYDRYVGTCPTLVSYQAISSKTGQGIFELMDRLVQTCAQYKLINLRIPLSYRLLIEQLERLKWGSSIESSKTQHPLADDTEARLSSSGPDAFGRRPSGYLGYDSGGGDDPHLVNHRSSPGRLNAPRRGDTSAAAVQAASSSQQVAGSSTSTDSGNRRRRTKLRKTQKRGELPVEDSSVGNNNKNSSDADSTDSILSPKSMPEVHNVLKDRKGMVSVVQGQRMPVMSMDDFTRMAQDFGVDPRNVADVAKFLHRNGDIAYFGDDWKLREYIFLDPQFLANVFASIVSAKTGISSGRLSHSLLRSMMWSDKEQFPPVLHGAMLQLLQKFDILYPLDEVDGETFSLVPSLISNDISEAVKSAWTGQKWLTDAPQGLTDMFAERRYVFRFLPVGFFGRAIVRALHSPGFKVAEFWRNGMLLRQQQNVALCEFSHNNQEYVLHVRAALQRRSGTATNFLVSLFQSIDSLLRGWNYNEYLELVDIRCPTCLAFVAEGKGGPKVTSFRRRDCLRLVSQNISVLECTAHADILVALEDALPEGSLSFLDRLRVPYDEFEIVEKIAIGQGTVVYKGTWQGHAVALKEFDIVDVDPMEAFDQFRQELMISSRLHHPNIVQLLGFSIHEGKPFTIQPLVSGGDLLNYIQNHDNLLDWPLRLRIGSDVTRGICYLHQNHIAHRDVKTPNVLLNAPVKVDDKIPTALVADFGISDFGGLQRGRNRDVDCPFWLAPEAMSESGENTEKSDVFSLAIVLWELLTRKRPYAKLLKKVKFDYELEDMVISGARCSLEDLPCECPESYKEILRKCWEAEPTARPTSSEVLQMLQKVEADMFPDQPLRYTAGSKEPVRKHQFKMRSVSFVNPQKRKSPRPLRTHHSSDDVNPSQQSPAAAVVEDVKVIRDRPKTRSLNDKTEVMVVRHVKATEPPSLWVGCADGTLSIWAIGADENLNSQLQLALPMRSGSKEVSFFALEVLPDVDFVVAVTDAAMHVYSVAAVQATFAQSKRKLKPLKAINKFPSAIVAALVVTDPSISSTLSKSDPSGEPIEGASSADSLAPINKKVRQLTSSSANSISGASSTGGKNRKGKGKQLSNSVAGASSNAISIDNGDGSSGLSGYPQIWLAHDQRVSIYDTVAWRPVAYSPLTLSTSQSISVMKQIYHCGQVWVGVDSGIWTFDPECMKTTATPEQPIDILRGRQISTVTALAEAPTTPAQVWVANRDRSLSCWAPAIATGDSCSFFELMHIDLAHSSAILEARFVGSILWTSGEDSCLRAWDCREGAIVDELETPEAVHSFAAASHREAMHMLYIGTWNGDMVSVPVLNRLMNDDDDSLSSCSSSSAPPSPSSSSSTRRARRRIRTASGNSSASSPSKNSPNGTTKRKQKKKGKKKR